MAQPSVFDYQAIPRTKCAVLLSKLQAGFDALSDTAQSTPSVARKHHRLPTPSFNLQRFGLPRWFSARATRSHSLAAAIRIARPT
jgi:hypothetical protein